MSDLKQSSLASAVRAEASNWQAVGSLYGQAASEIAELFANKGNPAVHIYMCAAQDLTGDPMVWNRAMSGLKKALAGLPTALQFIATRDFRPTHRGKAPLFELATKASVQAEAAEAARIADAKAKAIEADAAAQAAASKAEADAAITAADIAMSVRETCTRLGIDLASVVALLAPAEAPAKTPAKAPAKKAA